MIYHVMTSQGDVLFRRIDSLPEGVVEQPHQGQIVVAHSETGHHHTVESSEARLFERATRDPMLCYLVVDGESASVTHHRPFDTHASFDLGPGCWEVRRQVERTPQGWRRVED